MSSYSYSRPVITCVSMFLLLSLSLLSLSESMDTSGLSGTVVFLQSLQLHPGPHGCATQQERSQCRHIEVREGILSSSLVMRLLTVDRMSSCQLSCCCALSIHDPLVLSRCHGVSAPHKRDHCAIVFFEVQGSYQPQKGEEVFLDSAHCSNGKLSRHVSSCNEAC